MSVTINGTNGLVFNDNSTQATAATGFGFKNRLINGACAIDQRNNGASVVVANNNAYVVDRFRYLNSAGSVTCQQSTVAPAGFINSVLLTVGSTNTPGAADFQALRHVIEGLNVTDFAWGTASATPITISFWVRSSVTGTYSVGFRNSAVNRAYVGTYTISVANTFEYKTITVPGDTSGTWLTTNGVGIYIDFSLGTGSNNEITAGSWQASSAFAATGEVNWISNAGATFYITGVQLEKGSTATSFDYRPYGTELALCQRYYAKSYNQSTVPGSNAGTTNSAQGLNGTDGNQIQGFRTPVTMRTSATARVWTLSGTLASLSTTSEVNSNINNGSWSPYGMGDQGCRAIVGTGGLTSGTAYVYHWDASAEL